MRVQMGDSKGRVFGLRPFSTRYLNYEFDSIENWGRILFGRVWPLRSLDLPL